MFGCRARNPGHNKLQLTGLPSGSPFFVPAAGLELNNCSSCEVLLPGSLLNLLPGWCQIIDAENCIFLLLL
tara:strand:- start:455 stop:667 length:213 start_codon:yes stop_codon:yes gene_type:complete